MDFFSLNEKFNFVWKMIGKSLANLMVLSSFIFSIHTLPYFHTYASIRSASLLPLRQGASTLSCHTYDSFHQLTFCQRSFVIKIVLWFLFFGVEPFNYLISLRNNTKETKALFDVHMSCENYTKWICVHIISRCTEFCFKNCERNPNSRAKMIKKALDRRQREKENF